jgi:hypothetical protein
MWLPETAMYLASLHALQEHDIEFTTSWHRGRRKDPNRISRNPTACKLPNQQEKIVFFYNSFLSGENSFNPSATKTRIRMCKLVDPQINALSVDHKPFHASRL